MKMPSFYYASFRKAYKRFHPDIKIRNKKTASYFILSFTLISLSFFGIFAIRPTLITATSLIKSVADSKRLNMEYENKIGSLIRAQSEYEQIRDDLPLIEAALPTNAGFNKLAKAIEKYAQQEDVTITQLQIDRVPISTPSSNLKLNKYGFSFIGTGNYSSLTLLLTHITNWKRIANINSVDFNQDISTSSGIIRLSLKGETYYGP